MFFLSRYRSYVVYNTLCMTSSTVSYYISFEHLKGIPKDSSCPLAKQTNTLHSPASRQRPQKLLHFSRTVSPEIVAGKLFVSLQLRSFSVGATNENSFAHRKVGSLCSKCSENIPTPFILHMRSTF